MMQLNMANTEALGRTTRRVVSLQATPEGRLRQAAEEDSLTGVYNRATFRRHLAAAIDFAPGPQSVVLFLGLDDFTPVNDQFGHAAGGDAVLHAVTQRLRAAIRPDDLVARLGGDEFGVLLLADDSVAAVAAVARAIVDALTTPIALGGVGGRGISDQRISISVSIGATHVTGVETVDQILGRADQMMHEAKRAGGGQVRIDTRQH
jgi:diguanylate cyclase (GGDEF)-like protein